MKAASLMSLLVAAGLCLTGCGGDRQSAPGGALKVAATTSILGDVVGRIGGTNILLAVLLRPGQDPHAFNPTPADLAGLTRSRLLFANGLGLEGFLPRLPPGPRIVDVSRRLPFRRMSGAHDHAHEPHAETEGAPDPHVWFNPLHVAAWSDVIRDTLAEADPAHAAAYAERAAAYREELLALDAWIREQVAALPLERRRLVSDHAVLGYFADRYGFTLAGVIVPSFSSEAEPSARDLARLETTIRSEKIPALFVTRTVSPVLAERLAGDTGIHVAPFYDGALSEPDGPASTYLDFMRHNVSVFINALKE
jgi:zinc/manganese transport system substrate-binding protein